MLSEKEMQLVVHAAVREAVHETLIGLGFEMQSPAQLQADMHYLRGLRKGSEEVTRLVRHSVLTLAVSTALYLLWQAVKAALGK